MISIIVIREKKFSCELLGANGLKMNPQAKNEASLTALSDDIIAKTENHY